MNLKILFLILIYYGSLSLFFFGALSIPESNAYNISINFTDMTVNENEVPTDVGLWSSGVNFTRFIQFVAYGIGLPPDTPTWFSVLFFMWQSVIVPFFILGWLISSIWNG